MEPSALPLPDTRQRTIPTAIVHSISYPALTAPLAPEEPVPGIGNMRSCVLLLLSMLLPAIAWGATPPPVMLATEFRGDVDVRDYWVSEKMDGVRGRWDGKRLVTRAGQPIAAPAWFTAGWPEIAMDGELWTGRGRFDEASGIVRGGLSNAGAWTRVRFLVFDLPGHGGTFDARVTRMRTMIPSANVAWLQPVRQFRVEDRPALEKRLMDIVALGGEGLMLHRAGARYTSGRSIDLLKYKQHQDAEARVVAHLPGKGKYAGMLGALVVRMPDGRQFRLGSGFTDPQRAHPPPLGSWVTYRYTGLTSKGLPRFARFLRVREDMPPPDPR